MTSLISYPIAILAGGLATRLRPMTHTIPKALIDINGEPFINHQLRLLKKQGFSEVVLCVGYLGEEIEKIIGNGHAFGLNIQYSYDSQEKDKLFGTAGALKKALPILNSLHDAFFIMYGDSYLPCDYESIQNKFIKDDKLGLMTIFNNQGKWDSSNVEYDGENIIVYDKKNKNPQMQYIDYGIGVIQSKVLDSVPENTAYDLADVYKTLVSNKQLSAFEVKERFYEIGSWSGIEETKEFLRAL